MSKQIEQHLCTECGGKLIPRMTGFKACRDCGKLVVAAVPAPEPQQGGSTEPVAPLTDADFNLPDFAECCIGYRAWGVDPATPAGQVPLLQSVTWTDAFWVPREPVEAECDRRTHKPGQIPLESCSCGLYSAKTREHLMSMGYHKYDAEAKGLYHVVGSVSLWGKVIEGSQGWRSQFGYPRELFIPYEAYKLAAPLAEAYGIPVRLNNIFNKSEGK